MNIKPEKVREVEAWLASQGETLAGRLGASEDEIARWKQGDRVTDRPAYVRFHDLQKEMKRDILTPGVEQP